MTNPSAMMTGSQKGLGELKSRLTFLLLAIIVYRVGTHIPLPGINPARVAELFSQNEGTILGLFNMFSGGALERMSILALGVMPYISASIITQLLTAVIPSLEALKKEGEAGRRKISQYTRWGTLVLATVQGAGMVAGLSGQGLFYATGVSVTLIAVMSLVGGAMFMMWLGEQITERGIGNGISMLIFAGIVAGLPSALGQAFESARQGDLNFLVLILIGFVAIAVVWGVVRMERAQRRIPIHYARRQQGRRQMQPQASYLPLKINMAGVIPAIFASSILLFPASIAQWAGQSSGSELLQDIALMLSPGQPLNIILFTLMIVFFCYFYTAITFNSKEVSENLKRSGGSIPGIRPGMKTADYLDSVLGRLTLVGAIYIAAVCLMPQFLVVFANIPFYLGGTSLLIVVVVVMDFMAQIQQHMMSTQYDGLMKKANLKNYGNGAR
ncbi:preprotein translocase subunit SecY [Umboniibacter marinipuniceus]|uniref:Protein translocase subunit SecY n=1 Tax=Umboniibacter marinipuniceus TaxID=569599 RepID=A0A3L9ZZY3_9GAMM|nr:preprotein translocase subunit SecY [Umboniibacter marinipuniceus]RMA78431.1 protein translocase subunit secY/sec61 alpha [Umboniibacter marinipuniceus]